jgi:subfamily B ATP-binding cassette protein MsbA
MDIRLRFRYMKAQKGESFEMGVFDRANQRYFEMMKASLFIRSFITPIMEWVGLFIFAGFFWLWRHQYLSSELTPTVALQFFVALGVSLRPMRQLGEQVAKWAETVGALKRSETVFSEVLSHVEHSSESLVTSPAKADLLQLKPNILIRRLTISYGDRVVFGAENFALLSGRSIVILGASGAGKSTFVKCLAGLVSPTEWESDWPLERVCDHVSFVSQSPFLFKETIRSNLTYGLEGEILSETTDEMIQGALAVVGLQEKIRGLKLGVQTVFDPVATNLSGGEIQRLVIARALLRRRPILVLDEAMSALDGAREEELTDVLTQTVRETGSILISVTHRLRWLSKFDDVWLVEDGKIAMKGRPSDLAREPRFLAFTKAEMEEVVEI